MLDQAPSGDRPGPGSSSRSPTGPRGSRPCSSSRSGSSPAAVPARDAIAADRILRRWAEVRDPLARLLQLGVRDVLAQQVVVLLPRRVGADDAEAVTRRGAAVAGAGGQHEHVAGGDLERLSRRPAEL